jgi:hypothetical protein
MPSYYNILTTTVIVASSSGSGYYPLGISARYLMIQNYAATPLWAKIDACSTAASTSDIIITGCENARTKSFQFGDSFSFASKVTIVTTSTTNVPQFSIYASDGTTVSQ